MRCRQDEHKKEIKLGTVWSKRKSRTAEKEKKNRTNKKKKHREDRKEKNTTDEWEEQKEGGNKIRLGERTLEKNTAGTGE